MSAPVVFATRLGNSCGPSAVFLALNGKAFGLAAGTVRSMVGFAVRVHPNTTQDSPPVAGQALMGRDSHPQGSD